MKRKKAVGEGADGRAAVRSGARFSAAVSCVALQPQNSPCGLRQLRLWPLHSANTGNEKGAKSLTSALPTAGNKLKAFTSGIGRDHRGFTLLEILVAVSLIATALLVIIQLFSANLRGIAAAENYSHAVIKAEEALREVLDRKEFTEGTWSELRENRYRVDVRVQEVMQKRTETIPCQIYGISLTLRWAEGTKTRAISLSSLKLVERKI